MGDHRILPRRAEAALPPRRRLGVRLSGVRGGKRLGDAADTDSGESAESESDARRTRSRRIIPCFFRSPFHRSRLSLAAGLVAVIIGGRRP